MSNGKPAEPSEKDKRIPLEGRVEIWLSKQGYPLEARTAEQMKVGKFKVQQGLHVAGDDQKGLELDVLGARLENFGGLYLLAECKHIPEGEAWIGFMDSPPVADGPASGFGRSALSRELEKSSFDHLYKDALPKPWTTKVALALRTMVSDDKKQDTAFHTLKGVNGG